MTTSPERQREGNPAQLDSPRAGQMGGKDSDVSRHHSPELMVVHKEYRRGKLSRHTVTFRHDCGSTEEYRQEELPWLTE